MDSAIEAPGKESYGDIDTLVYGPLDPSWGSPEDDSGMLAENLTMALNAKKFIRQRGNPTINLAIPWPNLDDDAAKGIDKYVQLDVHTCLTPMAFQWQLFHTAHGDLWNIIGSTIRRFGLTVNDRGMYLRIPEIELYDRKRSMIFLTANPSEILRFLGLAEERWWRQFRSKEEMFEYAAECRMFWIKDDLSESEVEGNAPCETVATKNPDSEGQEGGEKGKKKLKHNDRQRMAKRPIFREWIEEFIPRCRERGVFEMARTSREQTQQEALTEFGVREEYETRLQEWRLTRHQDELWRVVIKGSVPIDGVDPALRAAAIRTLKATIMEGQEFEGVVPAAASKDAEGFYDLTQVRQFVLENWERAGQIGLARQKVRAAEMMEAKAAKRQMEAGDMTSKDVVTR